MSSTSERTFGARLLNANNLWTQILAFVGFSPPRDQDKPENLKILLDGITVGNANVAQAKEAYTVAVSIRKNLFKDSPTSMMKLLSPINGAIESHYGKKSVQYKMISGLINRIRKSKVHKAPKNPDDPDAKEMISKSTQSYGSLTQLFNDIITNLKQFSNYLPVNTAITTEALDLLSVSLTDSNKSVASTFGKRSEMIDIRLKMYADLKDRANRIKAHTKSVYGNASQEYRLIRGLNI